MSVPAFVFVLAFALLPVVGNVVGGLVAETVEVTDRALSQGLHLAAGVILAIVGVEMPAALEMEPVGIVLLGFLVGGGAAVGLDRFTDFVAARFADPRTAGGLGIYAGVAVDLSSDGLMVGAGSSIDLGLGVLLAVGQVVADGRRGSLAFTAAILLAVTVEEIIVEAHRSADPRWSALVPIAGFALFSSVSVVLSP